MQKSLRSSSSPLRLYPDVLPQQGWLWGAVCGVKGLVEVLQFLQRKELKLLSLTMPLPDQHSPLQPRARHVPEALPTRTEAAGAGTPPFHTALPHTQVCMEPSSSNTAAHALCPRHTDHS